MKYANIREEELKSRVARDYFGKFDSAKIIGNIDFCVTMQHGKSQSASAEIKSLLWAEAKKGKSDVIKSLVQLILTIGKARTFDKFHPPAFLGAFDAQQIAFVPYSEIHDIFYINAFNWNVAPSNHQSKEFKLVLKKVKSAIEANSLIFHFDKDDIDLKLFIKSNFVVGKGETSKIQIDKNNFIVVYNKWLQSVKPTIAIDWEIAKKNGIIDGDFYLADLLSLENETLKEKLFVLLKHNHYRLDRKIDESGMFSFRDAHFKDNQKAHTQFWNKYARPPHKDYWNYMVERRDLLVPQDIRERKGSFFTPQIWVELSQKYIADVLGDDWQDEYYVWDCAAGTGNLLAGLTNKYHIWASTLDQQDVEVMHDRIKNGANLLEEHVFQFDFLNDEFSKLPKSLQSVVSDPEKRKKLVIYINPPYAEATTARTVTKTGKNKAKTAIDNKTYSHHKAKIGKASNELFTHFLARVYCEIPACKIANFSTLKPLQSTNFTTFREFFHAKLERLFLVPADTFDNVNGQFPIGFFIWDSEKNEEFVKITADVYSDKGKYLRHKRFYGSLPQRINRWIKLFDDKSAQGIGFMGNPAPDFQNNKFLCISTATGTRHVNYYGFHAKNIFAGAIYFAVRNVIPPTWLNDRDQFLFPNKKWEADAEFQNDCLAFMLFHGQNKVSTADGVNHWIPFTEQGINARAKFDSDFMTQFIAGTLPDEEPADLLRKKVKRRNSLKFSVQAKAVFAAGKKLWRYYHATPNCNVNASLYDIREFFQGRNAKGVMNKSSNDETYAALISNLRTQLKLLAEKIVPKVYEYGFLKR